MPAHGQLTDLLNAAQSGDASAADAAYGIVYEDLRDRAGQSLRRMPGAEQADRRAQAAAQPATRKRRGPADNLDPDIDLT